MCGGDASLLFSWLGLLGGMWRLWKGQRNLEEEDSNGWRCELVAIDAWNGTGMFSLVLDFFFYSVLHSCVQHCPIDFAVGGGGVWRKPRAFRTIHSVTDKDCTEKTSHKTRVLFPFLSAVETPSTCTALCIRTLFHTSLDVSPQVFVSLERTQPALSFHVTLRWK